MTSIEWTDRVWNPVTGCTKVSKGCQHCYAERVFHRPYGRDQWPNGDGTFRARRFTDVECHPNRLDIPLHWRKPQRVFVNSMSDLFHEDVPDSFIDQVLAVMALCPQHTFQLLTKRPERMRDYLSHTTGVGNVLTRVLKAAQSIEMPRGRHKPDGPGWPLRNAWLGVSVEDQATADERIPLLLETPAAVRWASYEPALGPIEFREQWMHKQGCPSLSGWAGGLLPCSCASRRDALSAVEFPRLDWIVVGGESGPGARPFDVAWARSTVEQCKAASVPVFVKQLGARPEHRVQRVNSDGYGGDHGPGWTSAMKPLRLVDRKGGDPDEWSADLRVRQFPEVRS